jgi:hypothetical protein
MDNIQVNPIEIPAGKSSNNSSVWNFVFVIIILIALWWLFSKYTEPFAEVAPTKNVASIDINQYKDNSYPLLGSSKSQEDGNASIVGSSDLPVELQTPDVRAIDAMNKAGVSDASVPSCNMLGVNSAEMDDYKKNFYSVYSHQIECPKKCGMNELGQCGMGSACGVGKDCGNVRTATGIPDVFALNYLALDNNNKKSCVTCNYKPRDNELNRQWMADTNVFSDQSYYNLPEETKKQDIERFENMRKTDANVSNFVNFENNVYQNSIGLTQVDKIAEIRTSENPTCELKAYGNSISDAYDKLVATPTYTLKDSCVPYTISGQLEDSMISSNYANV